MGAGEDFQMQDQHGFFNNEDQKIPEGHPLPMLWKVLLMPVQPASMSKGTHGVKLHLPSQTQDNDGYLNYIGRVAAIGPLAGKSERYLNPQYLANQIPGAPAIPRWLWDVKPGDWVCYGRYAGQRIEYQGVKFILANDDEILAKISGPDGYRAYI